MSTEYKENAKVLLLDIYLNIFMSIYNTKIEYHKSIINDLEKCKKIREILKLFNEEDIKFIFMNENNTTRVEWTEKELLYYEGFKDCIKIHNILELNNNYIMKSYKNF